VLQCGAPWCREPLKTATVAQSIDEQSPSFRLANFKKSFYDWT
jgi:hypothetical protein